MANQQLVDYIKQQVQGGVQKDAVKKALLDAGWPAADVEESLSAAEQAASQPAAVAPQTIDPAAMMGSAAAAGSVAAVTTSNPSVKKTDTDKFFSEPGAPVEHARHGTRIAMIVMGALIVVLLGTLGYIYFNLNGKVSAVTGQSETTASQADQLRAQVQQFANDKTTLAAQVDALTKQSQTLSEEVSFVATPADSNGADVTATIHGMISMSGTTYLITSEHGIRITIKNSKDPRVDGGLKPLIGQSAVLVGTHRPGTLEITVTSINGTAINAPAAAGTSTQPAAPKP